MMKLAERVMKKLKESINMEVDYYSITTDIWSSPVMQSFIAVTLHYLTEEFNMQIFIIEVSLLKGSHTGAFIAECSGNTLSKFNKGQRQQWYQSLQGYECFSFWMLWAFVTSCCRAVLAGKEEHGASK
jgi:hypothetical protein